MEQLRHAILRALEEGDLLPDDLMEKMMEQGEDSEEVQQMLDRLIERLTEEGYINPLQPPQITAPPEKTPRGQAGDQNQERKRDLKSPTRPSIFSASKRCRNCSARSAKAVLAGTTRATSPPAWNPAAFRAPTNLATR